jgi:hypothetical protein
LLIEVLQGYSTPFSSTSTPMFYLNFKNKSYARREGLYIKRKQRIHGTINSCVPVKQKSMHWLL